MGIALRYQITNYPSIILLVTKDEEEFYSYLEHRDNSSSYLLDTSSNSTKIMKKRKYKLGKLKIIRSSSTISRFIGSSLSDLKEKEIFLSSYSPGSYLASLENTTEIVYKRVSSLYIAKNISNVLTGFKGRTYVATSFLDLIKYIKALRKAKEIFSNASPDFSMDSEVIYSSKQDTVLLERYK